MNELAAEARTRVARGLDVHSLKVITAMVVAFAATGIMWSGVERGIWVDLDVYVTGAQSVLVGHGLYNATTHGLPFTYPPFAALAFVPVAVVSEDVARLLFTVGALASYFLIISISARWTSLGRGATIALAIAGLSLEPVMRTLLLGQVNLFLMALVMFDVLVIPRRHRGWMIGIAAAVKIIPGAFAIVFLLQRDWRSVARSAVGLLACSGLAWGLAPEESRQYWSGLFLSVPRFGADAAVGSDNQSLLGVWLRLTESSVVSTGLVLSICASALALAVYGAHRLVQANDTVGALAVLALGTLMASPISWTHHYVWCLLVLAVLIARRRYVGAGLSGLLFWLCPIWMLPQGPFAEFAFDVGQQFVASLYVIWSVITLAAVTLQSRALTQKARTS